MRRSLAFALFGALAIAEVAAQSYPSRPVRMIVGYPAGGSIDTVGRIMAQAFNESMGQSFIVDNRPGASATIATSAVVKAPPDGYTLLVGAQASLSGAPSLIAKLSYDPLRDLSAIALIAHQPNVLIVHPSLPVRTTKDFIALAKKMPGKLAYGSSGQGSTQHLSAELFAMMTKTDLLHVPYKGGAPATVDLLSGELAFTFTPVPSALPHIRANKVRPVALSTSRRNETLPGTPTLDESGVRGYDFGGYMGLLGPAKLPRELVMKLNAEVQKAIKEPGVRKKLVDLGLDVRGGTPEQFTEFMRQDMDKCARIVAAAKIQPQ
ncbi:MAG TPA: tripartite tricarboxylate transporter substrate binding protein [Burkholderiales bacterium]|nr:tripartite tricarboxylate transporter substrate binding protein [Burkholderiales bacterium]